MLRMDEISNSEKSDKVKKECNSELISLKVKNHKRNPDLPFGQLIYACLKELKEYRDSRKSYSFNEKAYLSKMNMVNMLIEKLKYCNTDTELSDVHNLVELYHRDLLRSNYKSDYKSDLVSIFEIIKIRITARLNVKYQKAADDNAVELFNRIFNGLKYVETDRLVSEPNVYSWHGQELLIRGKGVINPRRHTLKDELLGKLFFVLKNNIDEKTKCTEMRVILDETYSAIDESWLGRPNFFNTGSRLRKAIMSLNLDMTEEFIEKKWESPIHVTKPLSWCAEYEDMWEKTRVTNTISNEISMERPDIEDDLESIEAKMDADTATIFALLDNYAKRSFANHREFFKDNIAPLRKPETKPKDIFTPVSDLMSYDKIKADGEFISTLRFAANKTNTDFYLCVKEKDVLPGMKL